MSNVPKQCPVCRRPYVGEGLTCNASQCRDRMQIYAARVVKKIEENMIRQMMAGPAWQGVTSGLRSGWQPGRTTRTQSSYPFTDRGEK